MSNDTDIQSFNVDTDEHSFIKRADKNPNRNKETGDYTSNFDIDCFPWQDKQLVKDSTVMVQAYGHSTYDHRFHSTKRNEQTRDHIANFNVDCFPWKYKQLSKEVMV